MMVIDITLAALVVVAATSLGAALVLGLKRMTDYVCSVMLAFCGGVMAFSLLEMFLQARRSVGDYVSITGLMAGALFLLLVDKMLPHLHAIVRKQELAAAKKRAALLAGAIALHNVPEGCAIASAFASSAKLGWLVTATIALQDIPEGVIVSVPLACYGMSKKLAISYGVFSGLVEAAAAVAGFLALNAVTMVVPAALSFSAGAMLYVVLVEMMPEAVKEEQRGAGVVFLLTGFAAAFVLSVWLP